MDPPKTVGGVQLKKILKHFRGDQSKKTPCISLLFPWILITGILVWPVVMAIYGQNGQIGPYMTHMAMITGQTDIPVMGIQGKSRKMAVFDQKYHHQKELSYRVFR